MDHNIEFIPNDFYMSPIMEAMYETMKPIRLYHGPITLPKGDPLGHGNVIFLLNPSREISYNELGLDNLNLRHSYKWYYIDTIYKEKIGTKKLISNMNSELKQEYKNLQSNKSIQFATQSKKKSIISENTNFIQDLSQWMNFFFTYRKVKRRDDAIRSFMEFVTTKIHHNDYINYNKIILLDMDNWGKSPNGGYKFNRVTDLTNPLSIFMAAAKYVPDTLSIYNDTILIVTSIVNKQMITIPMNLLTKKNLKLIRQRLSAFGFDEDDEDKMDTAIHDVVDDLRESRKRVLIAALRNNFVGNVEDVSDFRVLDTDEVPINEDDSIQREDDQDNQFFADIEAIANKYIDDNSYILEEDESDAVKQIQKYITEKYMTQKIKPQQDPKYQSIVEKMNSDANKVLKRSDSQSLKSKVIDTSDLSDYIQTLNPAITTSKFINFDKGYNDKKLEPDIDGVIAKLAEAEYPLFVVSKEVEDTSDSLNLKKTYTYVLKSPDGVSHTLKFDIPTIINNNYIRIGGSEKVIGHQMCLKPIVKISPRELELVSWYNKIFMYRQTNDTLDSKNITKYILQNDSKFSTVIGNATMKNKKYVTTIDFDGISKKIYKFKIRDTVFITELDVMRNYCEDMTSNLPPQSDTNPIVAFNTKTNTPITLEKDQSYTDLIMSLLNEEELKSFRKMKVGKKNNYVTAKMNGQLIPVVLFLLFCEGFKSLMEKASIQYDIIQKENLKNYHSHDWGFIYLSDCIVAWKRNPIQNSLLMDGLQGINLEIYSLNELEDTSTIINILSNYYGSARCGYYMSQFRDFMIDYTMKEILEDYNLPTNLTDLMLYAVKLLSTNNFMLENNMANMRIRSNELIPALLYQVVTKEAYIKYRQTAYKKKPTKVSVARNCVIKALFSDDANASKLIEEASSLNPVLTIEKSRSVTYKGPNGINIADAISKQKRGYDDSMLGAIAMVTPGDANVGVVRQLTLEPNITSTRGYIDVKGRDGLDVMSQANLLSPAEMLTPLSYQHDDPTRTAMTYKQSKYMVLVDDADPVLIGNKVESIIPYHSPEDFCVMSKQDGEVAEKTEDHIVIKYKDGTYKTVSLLPVVRKNAAAGFWIVNEFITNLNVGDRVKEGQAIAWDPKAYSKNRGDRGLSMKLGVFAKVAVAPNWDIFEDSAPVTYKLSQRLKTDMIDEKKIALNKGAFVDWMVKIGDKVKVGDPLIRFDADRDNDDFFQQFLQGVRAETKEEILASTMSTIKSKHAGEVVDIKVYQTVPTEQLDPSLQTIVTEYQKKLKTRNKTLDKYKNPGDSNYYKSGQVITEEVEVLKPDAQGKIKGKKVDDGILVCIYVKYGDSVKKGDKVCAEFALKGVISHVIPQGYEPYAFSRPEEEVSYLVAPLAITARKVPSIFLAMFGNKLLVEAKRQHELIWRGTGSVKDKRKKITDSIIKIMSLLDPTKANADYYKEFFGSMSDKAFSAYYEEFFKDEKFNYYLEIVEFERDLKMENIKKCAKYMNVPLFEYLALPYLNMNKNRPVVSQEPVPIGYVNLKRMQQTLLAKNHSSISIEKRNAKTGQVYGEDKNARNSDVETYALLASGAHWALKEFMGLRADDLVAKNEAYNLISQNGYLDMNDLTDDPSNRVSLRTLESYFMMQGIYTNVLDVNRATDESMKVYMYTDKIITKERKLLPVTNQMWFERGNIPTDDGLFSERIFGTTPKERSSTAAYIDLKEKFFHPYAYEVLKKLYGAGSGGKSKIDRIANGDGCWDVIDGELTEIKNPNDERYNEDNTGLKWLVNHYKDLKFKRNNTMTRNRHIDILESLSDDEIFITKWIVIPVFYRDLDRSNGMISIPEINYMYQKLIRYANSISPSEISIFNNTAMVNIQNTLMGLRRYGQELIAHKDGAFHKTVLGKSVDYGMRSVISTPTFIHKDHPRDMQVDPLHTGIPLALCLSGGYPFIKKAVMEFFDNLFRNTKNIPYMLKDKKTGKYKMSYISIPDQMDYFTEELIEKKMKEFQVTFDKRFEPVTMKVDGKEDVYIGFTGRPYGAKPDDKNAAPIADRPLTWTDVFYICAMQCLSDKHCYTTRYPLVDYFGCYPTRVMPLSTVATTSIEVDGIKYPHYPVIDPYLPENEVGQKFIDTITMSNIFLEGIGGDYDGDTVTCKIVFSIQANQEAERLIMSMKQYIRIDGSNVRSIGNEPYLTFYNMTKRRVKQKIAA